LWYDTIIRKCSRIASGFGISFLFCLRFSAFSFSACRNSFSSDSLIVLLEFVLLGLERSSFCNLWKLGAPPNITFSFSLSRLVIVSDGAKFRFGTETSRR
jgi:hypothetical protein